MKIAISGASGLLGTEFSEYLRKKGHNVLRLVRRKPGSSDEIEWNPISGKIDKEKLENINAIVNFSGENIGLGRWTKNRKKVLFESRIDSTRLLADTVAQLKNPPQTFLSSSAIGIYGDCGSTLLNEGTQPGKGFLSELCVKWEKATDSAMKAGIRVIQMRIGVVLSSKGGALKKMLPAFYMGVGGKLGSGTQYFSWILIDDFVRAVYHLLISDNIQTPVNINSHEVVTNYEFTKTLGKVINRPTFLPLPGFVLKILFGQVAEELLLSSSNAVPQILIGSGFEFKYPRLEDALRFTLKK
ncbi:MAG: TIGR01777 family protein [Candidatus Marinimicrobia bacterium]|nr:TIGR01777 family protein [Candidatus Neomarinimicrobiota bacterium]